eukprot:gene28971-32158_t
MQALNCSRPGGGVLVAGTTWAATAPRILPLPSARAYLRQSLRIIGSCASPSHANAATNLRRTGLGPSVFSPARPPMQRCRVQALELEGDSEDLLEGESEDEYDDNDDIYDALVDKHGDVDAEEKYDKQYDKVYEVGEGGLQQEDAVASGFAPLGLSPELAAAIPALLGGGEHILASHTGSGKTLTFLLPVAVGRIGKLGGGGHILASHTGSGKTLAFLLPVIQMMKQQEELEGFVSRPKRPRALILGPTKELTEQITSVAKHLGHYSKIRACCISASQKMGKQAKMLSGPLDVLVATPTRFLQHVSEGNLYYRDVRWLVVDEADTIFSEGWGTELKKIIGALRNKGGPVDIMLVSATMTKPIRKLLDTSFPNIKQIVTSSLHKAVAGSQHRFVSQVAGSDKLKMLKDVLSAEAKANQKVLVFCNTVDSCRAVEHACMDDSIPVVCYHGDMPIPMRQETMRLFAGNAQEGGDDDDDDEMVPRTSLGRREGFNLPPGRQPIMIATDVAARGLDFPGTPIMIATDVAARGLDFSGTVDLVINFDFPFTPVDYIHRTGRTARAGNKGRITSLIGKRDRILANRIEWALKHNEPLDALSSDPRILPPSQRPKPSTSGRGAVSGGRGSGTKRSPGGRGIRGAGPPKRRSSPGSKPGPGPRPMAPSTKGITRNVRGAARVELLDQRLEEKNKEKENSKKRARVDSKRAKAEPLRVFSEPTGAHQAF